MSATHDDDHDPEGVTILDALPYIDAVNEDYEQYALALIDDEMKQNSNKRRKVSSTVDVVKLRTEAAKEAYERAQAGTKAAPVLPLAAENSVAAAAAPPESAMGDVQAWNEAVNKARIAYELERLRGVQLEVDREDGPASSAQVRKRYNEGVLEPQQAHLLQQLTRQQKTVEEINFSRQKDQQERCGRQLQVLTSQYEELVQKQFQLKHAIADLEEETSSRRNEQQQPQQS